MKILLVSATPLEIRPLLSYLEFIRKGSDFLDHYRFRKTLIDVLVPGIGMAIGSYHMGKQLASAKYDLAINAGICGAYSKSLKVGTVVEVIEERFPELGAEDGDQFINVFDLGLTNHDMYPFNHGIISNKSLPGSETLKQLKKVSGNTVNTIHGNRNTIEKIKALFPSDVETMEGAAFLYSCLLENIPCAEVRAVSNFVDERSLAEWDIKLAVKNLNSTLRKIIDEVAV
jgi:futalosine hydrolase